jgi:hypothetical protein
MTSFQDDFPYRVNYAAQCIMRGITSRRRDSCYENDDGDLVVVALVRRAIRNPKLWYAIVKDWGGAFPQDWLDLEERYRATATRDLKVLAKAIREGKAQWDKAKKTWEAAE